MSAPATSAPAATLLTPTRARLVLVVIAIALISVVSAVSGLNIALPSLARDTGATQTQITWIVDAYTVTFAGLLLFAGAIGDRFGRKLLLILGLLLFGTAAAIGLATTAPEQLILVRIAMGVGAAAIMPTTLSVITTSFPENQRPQAIGLWVGIAGGGAVLGLFAAGFLLEYFPWQSFFGLNVALAATAALGAVLIVPNSRESRHGALDIVGALLSLVTIASLVYGFIEGPDLGWSDPLTLGAFGLGVLAGVGFVLWELRVKAPMLDPRLFLRRGFSAGTLTICVQFLCSFGLFFIAIQYLQYVTGRSPLEAAVALLPLPLVLLPLSRQVPTLFNRVGFRILAPLGLLSVAGGFLIFSRLEVDSPYWVFALGLVFFATGMGMAAPPATTTITASLPRAKQGVASAVNDTSREVGSALGIAILGSLLNQGYRDNIASALTHLPPALAAQVRNSIAFTGSPAIKQLGPAGELLVRQAREAFMHGVSTAVLVASGIAAVGALVIAFLAPPRKQSSEAGSLPEVSDPVA